MKKNLKFVSAVLIAVIMLVQLMIPVFAADNGTFKVSDASGNVGDSVLVTVSLSDNPGFVSANLNVNFDDSVLKLTKVEDTGVLSGQVHSDQYKNPYVLSWANDLSRHNLTVNGDLVKLTFEIVGNTDSGKTEISLSQEVVTFDLQMIELELKSGTVSISGGTSAEKKTGDSSKATQKDNSKAEEKSTTAKNDEKLSVEETTQAAEEDGVIVSTSDEQAASTMVELEKEKGNVGSVLLIVIISAAFVAVLGTVAALVLKKKT